jgi:hypothetical protein
MHVKSHQDDKTPAASLSLKTWLYIEADHLAAEYINED